MATPVSFAPAIQDSVEIAPITRRYNDAYALARFQTGLGATIKILALTIGGFVTVAFLLYMLSESVPTRGPFGPTTNPIGTAFGLMGMTFGVLTGAIGWIYGSSISAQGQILKAVLDTAVNTSPFLDNAGRASMMSILR